MQRLEAKSIHGLTYYYLSQWGWKNGKCRRLSQKYLGKLEDLAQAVQGTGPAPEYAVVLDWGLPQALWREADRAQVVEHVNQLGPKRAQGLSTGDYIRLAAINRACEPVSKQAMWDWVSGTSLPRVWPEASAAQLTSQHFWVHMERIQPETAQAIWQQLIAAVLQREQIALSQICYDGTNFYTFIDTFNLQSQLAKRGKNKQGRSIFGKSAMRCSARPMNTCHCFTTFMRATATMQNSFRRCWRSFSVGSKSGLVPRGRRLNRRSSSTKEITPPTTSPCWTLWNCPMWARSNWMNIPIWQPFPTRMPAGSPPRSPVGKGRRAGVPSRWCMEKSAPWS